MTESHDWRDGYLGHLAHERRLSALTCQHYGRDIDVLFSLVEGQSLAGLQVHDIRRCIASLHGKGLGGRSLARMLSAWRGFFTYLARNHGLINNPCLGLRPPKSAKRLPQALSPDEAARLMGIPTDDALAFRDKAILELAYSSGLRVSEITGLTLLSVSQEEGQVIVTGKGGKTRIVPVGRKALAALETWLPLRATLAKGNEQALFVGRNGRRLGARAIQLRLKIWSLKQGMRINVHPHVLRHSFASHLLQSSSDLRGVQEMLGHASIGSTQVYTHLDFQHLLKVYDAAHPRAKRR
ncbi:MAG: tyrosine recombinase XerC [Pseudomonadota bacterium]|nr:tyrosine recombinase XerC [Pseudomonadota bacterium]